jgi:F-type H+-transporting ATPase subunit b
MAAEGPSTIEGTEAPGESAGLPQMNAETFPSQLFWLVITFGLLFVVLSKLTLPRIAGTIADRRGRIEGDLGAAEASRQGAADAQSAYEAALTQARARALALAEENRKRVLGEVDKLKAGADAEAASAAAAAEKRIAAERAKAASHIQVSAADAAADIVERLIGVKIAGEDAAKAVDAEGKRG